MPCGCPDMQEAVTLRGAETLEDQRIAYHWRQCWRRLGALTATWWARAQTLPFLSKSLPNQAAPAYPMPFIAKCMARSTPLSSRWEKSGSGLSSNRSRFGDFSQPRRRSNRRPHFDRAAKFSTQTADLDMGGPYERFFGHSASGQTLPILTVWTMSGLPLGATNCGHLGSAASGQKPRRERAAATQTMWEATAATSRTVRKVTFRPHILLLETHIGVTPCRSFLVRASPD